MYHINDSCSIYYFTNNLIKSVFFYSDISSILATCSVNFLFPNPSLVSNFLLLSPLSLFLATHSVNLFENCIKCQKRLEVPGFILLINS